MEKLEKYNSKLKRHPSWITVKAPFGEKVHSLKKLMTELSLNTVCQEAKCPNMGECWSHGVATFMILGDVCTRACGFCSVKTGKPTWNDSMEPMRTAITVKKMGLSHVVVTSVDRDDLQDDYGAEIWAETINQIHKFVPKCTVEVLTPDFKGYFPALKKVFDSGPDLYSHNLECVERISKKVRAQANWNRSFRVLKFAKEEITPSRDKKIHSAIRAAVPRLKPYVRDLAPLFNEITSESINHGQ